MTGIDPKRTAPSYTVFPRFGKLRINMQKIETGQLIATFANVGVIVGLVFLILEIQQANRIAIATSEIEVRSLYSELNEALYAVPEINELLVKAQDGNVELSDQEKVRAEGLVLRLANAWRSIEVAYENDLVPTETFSTIEDDVRSILTVYPALAPTFRQMIEDYPGQRESDVFLIIEKVLAELGIQ